MPMGIEGIPARTNRGWRDVVEGCSERMNWQKEETLDIMGGPISELRFVCLFVCF